MTLRFGLRGNSMNQTTRQLVALLAVFMASGCGKASISYHDALDIRDHELSEYNAAHTASNASLEAWSMRKVEIEDAQRRLAELDDDAAKDRLREAIRSETERLARLKTKWEELKKLTDEAKVRLDAAQKTVEKMRAVKPSR